MNARSIAIAGLLILVLSPIVSADTGGKTQPEDLGAGLAFVDWLIVGIYAGSTLVLGWYYGRKQTSTREYFVGSGKINPVLVGVSLFATLLSTISYLSMPGEALGKGPINMATMLCYPLVFVIVGFWLLPVYMKHRVTSAYELLEIKLGRGIRTMGAAMFVSLRLVWMSLLVYLTAKAMTVMLGVTEDAIPMIVLITGLIAVVYTSLGGLQAVIITDCLQTLLLYGGALVVLAMITFDMGFAWFPTEWQANWDTQPIVSLDPKTRVTLLGSVMNFLVWYVATSGGDQVSVQRFMATEDASAARKAFAVQLCVSVIVGVTLGLVGFALLGYFEAHPEFLKKGMSLKDDADDVFPHFIAFQLPVGVSGFVVAAMFAAAMSSIDSGINSITAVVLTDFLGKDSNSTSNDRSQIWFARILAFAIGAIVVVGSCFIGAIPGNITAVTQKTSNLLTTPIFALFVFALFIPFARKAGVIAGAICGTLTAVVIGFSGPIVMLLDTKFDIPVERFGVVWELKSSVVETANGPVTEYWQTVQDPISFQWIGVLALLVNILVGSAVSWAIARRESK
ncbi:MAG: sodium-coupled permease [Planctomycetota bacterium]|nr:sodium-coupled permease [Planctomycetota bacterium]